jgi:hypothetical protein
MKEAGGRSLAFFLRLQANEFFRASWTGVFKPRCVKVAGQATPSI